MIADEIARYLATRSIGVVYGPTSSGGNVFVDDMPDEPDTAVYVGTSPGPEADSKLGYDHPRTQILTRAAQRKDAYDLARAIYSELHGLHDVALPEGTWVVSCLGIQSEPAYIGKDPHQRYEYSQNYQSEVRSLTANRE